MTNLFYDRRFTFLISFIFHIIILVIFSFLTVGSTVEELDYVTVDFGSPGTGEMGESPITEKSNASLRETSNPDIIDNKDKVEQPKVTQEFEELIKKNNKTEEEYKKIERSRKSENISKNVSKNETGSQTFGSSGYSFDWGGRGTRKILRWEKPKFPPGVQKEIDIKIKFTILPDGSVVSPIPLIKADTQLEDAAIQALKTWKFEPLSANQIQFEQTVIITIPYRLE